ncbi:MAG: hypothetical protein JRN20_02355 [Nitrososphaerota archaeon]|nr:hypothetical protein [Nitrososphaerota archaeon]MDG6924192.1 hypothetical protein [Nitrososphaerota archaeon]
MQSKSEDSKTSFKSKGKLPWPSITGSLAAIVLIGASSRIWIYASKNSAPDFLMSLLIIVPYLALPVGVSVYSYVRYKRLAGMGNFIVSEFLMVGLALMVYRDFSTFLSSSTLEEIWIRYYLDVVVACLAFTAIILLHLRVPPPPDLPENKAADSESVQVPAPLIAFAVVIATAIPLGMIALQNMSSYVSPLEENLSNFFMFGYFPTISICSPVAYSILSNWKYGHARGLGSFTLTTVILSLLIVGGFWFLTILGGIALSGGQ